MDPSGSRVAIRRAKLNDAATLERIEGLSFDADRLSRRSLNQHLQSETADVLLAEIDGHAVGYAMMFYRRGARVGRLYSIATLAEARGKGAARALMAACERHARKRGCATLRLEVRTDNTAAIGLYKQLGYVAFGRYEEYYEDGAPALRFDKPLMATGRGQTPKARAA